jgi:hypothetical protein
VKAILRKIIISVIAGAMLAVSAGVLVVSAAFAVFGVLKAWVGAPGAAALTALAAAILMMVVALSFEAWLQGSKGAKAAESDQDLLQRLIGMVQERPILSAGALAGVVALAIRNPALVAIVVKAFLDPKGRPVKKA